MSTKSPECYTSDPKTKCLRDEISPGHTMLLPHEELAFARLKAGDEEQNLRIAFAKHELLIRGHCLRRIRNSIATNGARFVM